MKQFSYKGRSKVIDKITEHVVQNSQPFLEDCSFIIMSNRFLCDKKTLGSPLMSSYYGESVLNYYLNIINATCVNPTIIIVSSCDPKRIMKHENIHNIIFIEKVIGDLSNNADDMKIGLFASKLQDTFIFDSHFMPSYLAIKELSKKRSESSLLYTVEQSYEIGCEIGETGMINFFSYKAPNKLMGASFFTKNDIEKLKKRLIGSSFHRNKFYFEMLDEIKIRGIENNTPSFTLDRKINDQD